MMENTLDTHYPPCLIIAPSDAVLDAQTQLLSQSAWESVVTTLGGSTFKKTISEIPQQSINEPQKPLAIEQVRQLQAQSIIPPNQVLIWLICLDGASLPAQQALLKLLEEPPKNVLIVIWAESDHAILETIASRAWLVKLKGVGLEVNQFVEDQTIQELFTAVVQNYSPAKKLSLIQQSSAAPQEFAKDCLIWGYQQLSQNPEDPRVHTWLKHWLACWKTLQLPAIQHRLHLERTCLALTF